MGKYLNAAVCLLLIALLVCPQVSIAETVYFYHTDSVGTPLAMTNGNGDPVWGADYLPFGEVFTESGMENMRKFLGKERDLESNLDYLEARYHYAKIGRFLEPDAIRSVNRNSGKVVYSLLENTQRTNVYSYSMNNLFKYIDEDGNIPVLLIPLGFLAAKALGAGIAWLGMRGSVELADKTLKSLDKQSFNNKGNVASAIDGTVKTSASSAEPVGRGR